MNANQITTPHGGAWRAEQIKRARRHLNIAAA
jgi:hypothetical protein